MQITRYPSLTEPQFLGCVSAFADTLLGELNSAAMYLRKLHGKNKGAAFAYEMSLDRHRYGALSVLDRWSTLVGTFAPHLTLTRFQGIVDDAPSRVRAAEGILEHANRLLDGAEIYTAEIVEACALAFQSLGTTFAEEQRSAQNSAQLGPMLPEEFREARGIFLEDLAVR